MGGGVKHLTSAKVVGSSAVSAPPKRGVFRYEGMMESLCAVGKAWVVVRLFMCLWYDVLMFELLVKVDRPW